MIDLIAAEIGSLLRYTLPLDQTSSARKIKEVEMAPTLSLCY